MMVAMQRVSGQSYGSGIAGTRRPAAGFALLAALILAALTLGASPAAANIPPYAEPSYTKPVGGANVWHWEATPPGGVQTAYCFSFSQGPSFSTYQGFATGEPLGVPFNYCHRRDTSRTTYSKQLVGVANGQTWRYCGQEWVFISGSWSASAYPVQCMDTTIDTSAPTIGMLLASGATYATSAAIPRTINYTDSVSPPWADNRICTINSRACNAGDTFNFDSACSSGAPATLGATFNCTYTHGGGDGTVWQCVYGFDSASVDAAPNLTTAPVLNVNPAYPAGTGNASAISCDSIILDRAAPTLVPSASATTVQTGQPVDFGVSASDLTSGLAGQPSWSFGDGGTATGSAPSHTFTSAGTRTVTVSHNDAAGNTGTATLTITVQAPAGTPTPTATPGGPTPTPVPGTPGTSTTPATGSDVTPGGPTTAGGVGSAAGGGGTTQTSAGGLKLIAPKKPSLKKLKQRRLPLSLTAPSAGKAALSLQRGSKKLASTSATFTGAGTIALRLRLPKGLKPGKTKLRLTFTPAGGGPAITRSVSVEFKR